MLVSLAWLGPSILAAIDALAQQRIWGQPLNRHRVGPARGPVTAFFNGRVFTGNLRQIPLLAHSQIELEVGRPLAAPDTIAFPRGL